MPNIKKEIKHHCFLIFLFLFSSLSKEIFSQNKVEVLINEILINNNFYKDSYGNYSSWIELYNSGKNSLDISGYGLSNEEYIPFKWTFPKKTIINSGDYLIVFASEKKSKAQEFHTNFELNKNG